MEAVKQGGDRQQLHEIIRRCSMQATAQMKNGEPWDLLALLAGEKEFSLTKEQMQQLLQPQLYIGRCAEQVDAYLEKLHPLLEGIDPQSPQINL